jgi:hypothetical protein
MRHLSDYTLIDRGRKAGLSTSELYSALSSRRPESGDRPAGSSDGNGFVSGVGAQGRPTYRPVGGYRNG